MLCNYSFSKLKTLTCSKKILAFESMSYFTHSSGLTYCDSVICVFFKQGNATDSGGDSLNCSSVSNFSTSFRITRNTDQILHFSSRYSEKPRVEDFISGNEQRENSCVSNARKFGSNRKKHPIKMEMLKITQSVNCNKFFRNEQNRSANLA